MLQFISVEAGYVIRGNFLIIERKTCYHTLGNLLNCDNLSLLSSIPHPPWPLLISDVGLELERTLINCSLL